MCHTSFSLIGPISDKDKPHIMFFLQFYINFKVLFSDPVFSPKQLELF